MRNLLTVNTSIANIYTTFSYIYKQCYIACYFISIDIYNNIYLIVYTLYLRVTSSNN
jgi:hypothetical protein